MIYPTKTFYFLDICCSHPQTRHTVTHYSCKGGKRGYRCLGLLWNVFAKNKFSFCSSELHCSVSHSLFSCLCFLHAEFLLAFSIILMMNNIAILGDLWNWSKWWHKLHPHNMKRLFSSHHMTYTVISHSPNSWNETNLYSIIFLSW